MTKATIVSCEICRTQKAHGNHFGVNSCRACAAFFRRTVHSRWSRLKCQGGSCNRSTFFCKPCRLQRCFERGMETSNFQYNRDGIVCSTLVSNSIPPSFEHFVGKPIFVMYHDLNGEKTRIDLHRLLGEATKILNLGAPSPLHSESQLKRLSLGMQPASLTLDLGRLKTTKRATQKEVMDNWEYYFITVARWLTHFDEYKRLSRRMQMTLLMTVWHVWQRLEKLAMTAKYRRANRFWKKTEIVLQGGVMLDHESVEFDSSWLSNLPGEQVRGFLKHASCDQYDVTAALVELEPTDVELTYMLAQLCFEYAGKRSQGEMLALTDRYQEVLSNDLHDYYVNELHTPRYFKRLAKMMQINNGIQKNIREGRVRMELAKMFNIIKIEFTHPEMFLDSGFH